MQVRSLSPTSLWIEMPLSTETPRLVWRAMAAAGLSEGKINSYDSIFFDPGVPNHQHLVEGCTASGLFRDNTRIVVELLPEAGGTRLNVDGARTDGGTDLTFRLRKLKRHYTQQIQEFLLNVPGEPEGQEVIPLPPLALPTGDGGRIRFVEAQNDFILPLRVSVPSSLNIMVQPWKDDWKKALVRFVLYGALGIIVCQFRLWGPLLLGLAGMEVWTWRKYRWAKLKFSWLSFFLLALLGGWQTWALLHRWF